MVGDEEVGRIHTLHFRSYRQLSVEFVYWGHLGPTRHTEIDIQCAFILRRGHIADKNVLIDVAVPPATSLR